MNAFLNFIIVLLPPFWPVLAAVILLLIAAVVIGMLIGLSIGSGNLDGEKRASFLEGRLTERSDQSHERVL